eukprot:m.251720 g.251720  ORF g.251720 m.251720 type:complete len:101 (-) comp19543_c0_seq6:24-326(-)
MPHAGDSSDHFYSMHTDGACDRFCMQETMALRLQETIVHLGSITMALRFVSRVHLPHVRKAACHLRKIAQRGVLTMLHETISLLSLMFQPKPDGFRIISQ